MYSENKREKSITIKPTNSFTFNITFYLKFS